MSDEYPKMLYRGKDKRDNAIGKIAKDAEAEVKLKRQGWNENPEPSADRPAPDGEDADDAPGPKKSRK
jgi:hypothetical protein